jgi:hypothetical protein
MIPITSSVNSISRILDVGACDGVRPSTSKSNVR